jgi:glyoxylase-like metal-dependent hydrolase (beta-lactamase superfamily II)
MEIHPRVSEIDLSGFGVIWSFLIRGEKVAIIDTGQSRPLPLSPLPDKNVPPILQCLPSVLEKLALSITDIDLILNTHVHFDHTGGDAELKKACNAPIFIYKDEVRFLENPELVFDADVAPVVEAVMGKERVGEEKKRYMEMVQPGKDVVVERGLNDNEIIELGKGCDLKVIHLPGHTHGSVGFYMEEDGILFAGDAMQGICEHDGGLPIIDDLAAYETSLDRVQGMPLKVLVNSHPFRGITIRPSILLRDGEIKTFIDECREFTRILRQAAAGIAPDLSSRPFLKLYDEVISKLPTEWGLKPSAQLRGLFFSAATLLNCVRQIT